MDINSWDEVIDYTDDISRRTGKYIGPINQALKDRRFSPAQEAYLNELSNFNVSDRGVEDSVVHICRDVMAKFCQTSQMRPSLLSRPGREEMFRHNCLATIAISETAYDNTAILLQDSPQIPEDFPALKTQFAEYMQGNTQTAQYAVKKVRHEILPALRVFIQKELGMSAEAMDDKIAALKLEMIKDPLSSAFQGIENTAPIDPVKWHTLKNAPPIGPAPEMTNE